MHVRGVHALSVFCFVVTAESAASLRNVDAQAGQSSVWSFPHGARAHTHTHTQLIHKVRPETALLLLACALRLLVSLMTCDRFLENRLPGCSQPLRCGAVAYLGAGGSLMNEGISLLVERPIDILVQFR